MTLAAVRDLGVRPVAAMDPLRPLQHGRYDDGVVSVSRSARMLSADIAADGRLVVRHGYVRVDDDVTEQLADVLRPLTDDPALFARAFVGVVRTTHRDPLAAWEAFYRASLARLDDPAHPGYVQVHRHAATLLPATSVLDLGASFGFLALHLARRGTRVIAADTDGNAMRLLALMAGRLGIDVATARGAELATGGVDAVALIHVLEHLDETDGAELLAEAMRLARHRVVVAVPYEDEPTALYGHVRAMTAAALVAHARPHRVHWQARIHEHHGGWLILDRR